ncbi:OprD family outer membrane porin [Salinisphaera sp. G21_0]|uniref:OprD family outer membrane porin n=1 Tax=Salinisphaera sp. G21_0 TaxID=2821094 RepID=UPI001ADC620F|nr:OprD family outer membrane porin [Salinisphaera sp. G21_0]MBO9484215.1 OprD family outer membrane porin [Salinisphaera sp. G21_0]
MTRLKPYLLSYAVALFSVPVIASDSYDSFISDAKIDGKVQSVFFDDENTTDNINKGAWTGAVWLNAQTGYLAEVVSVGGSAYRVAKLDMKHGNATSSNLLNADNEGFGKIGQIWVDFKLPDSYEGLSADVKIGRQLLETGLVTISGSRSVPSAWQGVDASVAMDGFKGKIAWLNEVSERTQSGFHPIVNEEGKQIDWVMGMQLGYTFELANQNSLELQYRNGLADNYLTAHNGNVWLKMPLYDGSELTLGGMYFYAKQDGDLWGASERNGSFENKAELGNLNATLNSGPWTFNAAFNYTKANTATNSITNGHHTIGHYNYNFGANTHGVWDVPTSANISDFNLNKEKAWLIGAEYDFSDIGLEGLSLAYNFVYGSGMKAKELNGTEHDVAEHEHDLTMKYNFSQWGMKDLQFKLEYGYYRNDEALRKATGQNESEKLRAWLSYNFII